MLSRVKVSLELSPSRCHRRIGYAAASFEVSDRPEHEDFLDGVGYAYTVSLAMRLVRSVLWFNVESVDLSSLPARTLSLQFSSTLSVESPPPTDLEGFTNLQTGALHPRLACFGWLLFAAAGYGSIGAFQANSGTFTPG